MTVVVSFQRAINVGRGRTVPMADLKAVYEAAGCRDVRTWLQSGNVVFATDANVRALTAKLEAAIAKRFGFAIPVVNLTVVELAETVRANPFPTEAKADPAHLVVVLLPGIPTKAEQGALAQPIDGPERMKLVGADLYVHYAAGIGRSRLKLPLKAPGTARNWTTIKRLLAMAEEANSQPAAATLRSRRAESAPRNQNGDVVMAKGQQKPNKEKRKPKADKNKAKKGAMTPMPGASSGSNPPMKKM